VYRFLLTAVFSSLLGSGGGAVCEEFAQPPVWSEEVKSVFFDDARKALSGPRPTASEQIEETARSPNEAKTTSVHWQELIDRDTLTAEVKRIVNNLPSLTKNPALFKASKHNDCRRELTMLAALFKVIAEYPTDVRWKSNALDMVRRCVSAAESCDDVSENSLAIVEETHAMLEELLRGQTLDPNNVNSGEAANIPAFAPLMKRMELATEDTLPPQLVKEREFRKSAPSIAEDAQLLAMLSELIRDETYGYADDEAYQGHADRLRDAAVRLRSAATEQDFVKAVEAAAGVSQSCANCHADYRG
jgi:hypothetical protein